MPLDPTIAPGTRIGHVVVEREIGSGAFGVVYLGRDTLIDRPVALKALRGPDHAIGAEARARFLAEARAVGALRSQNVVVLHHVHETPDHRWVLEMEYVDGGSLEDLLARDVALPTATAVRIARGVLDALVEAHDRGLLHADVKPANVLLARDGVAKLADFGLARALHEPGPEDEGSLAGTPSYMAPEVILGEPPVLASDLWSVGVLLHRMLTGRHPFEAEDLTTLFSAVQNDPAPELEPPFPERLANVVSRLLAKRPQERLTAREAALALEHALDAPARAAAPAPRGPASIVAREPEQATLRRVLGDVASGRGATLLVTGAEGIGKSTLAREAVATAQRMGFTTIEAAVSPLEGLVRPLLRSARRALAATGDGSPAGDPRVDPAAFGSASRVLRSLLVGEAEPEIENRQQMVWALFHLMSGLARDRPLLVLVEDAHRVGTHEWNLLRDLAHRFALSRVALLLTWRTADTERPGRDTQSGRRLAEIESTVRVPLGPLAAPDVLEVVEREVPGRRISAEVAERIVRGAEGNARFAVELLRHFEESGAVREEDGVLVPGRGFEVTAVPDRLADLLSQRLADLPDSVQALLDAAAVDGLEFEGRAVGAVLGKSDLTVLRQLQRIYRERGLVVPRATGYRFAQALLHDLVYERVAPELRRMLHRKFAEHLEKRGEEVDPERLGVHWERAGLADRARPHLLRAADRLAGVDPVRAVDLARRAGLAPGHVEAREAHGHAELLLRLARAHSNVGAARPDVEALYELVVQAADAARDPVLRLRAVVRRASYRALRGGLEPAEEGEVRRAAESLPPSLDQGRAKYVLGYVARVRGDLPEAKRWLRAADEALAPLPGSDNDRSSVLDQLATVASREGRLAEAEDLYARAAELSERVGRQVNAEISRVNALLAAIARGAVEGARHRLETAVRTFTLLRSPDLAAHTRVLLAKERVSAGDLDAAEREIDEAVRRFEKGEYLPGLAQALCERAHVLGMRGRLPEALRELERAEEAARRRGAVEDQVAARIEGAALRVHAGDVAAATREVESVLASDAARGDAQVRGDVALRVAEMILFGLPADVAPRAERWLAECGEGDTLRLPRVALRSAVALARPDGSVADLRAGAEALLGDGVGARRASRRVVGRWMAAEADRRGGDGRRAAREAATAWEESRALGDVWLEEATLALLVGLARKPDHVARLQSLRAVLGRASP